MSDGEAMKLYEKSNNRYYFLLHELLAKAQEPNGLLEKDIKSMVSERGFFADNIKFEKALLNKHSDSANNLEVLELRGSKYYSKLSHAPTKITLTSLEKQWLKTLLEDPRTKLFLSCETLEQLKELLRDVSPLYNPQNQVAQNMRNNGDPYEDPNYVRKFKIILRAIQEKQLINVENKILNGNTLTGVMMPHRLEYSIKDDVFRVCGAVEDARTQEYIVKAMRISRLSNVSIAGPAYEQSFSELMKARAMATAVVEIRNVRNGYERFLNLFSNYPREAKYDEKTKTLIISIDYHTFDHSAVAISILAMGTIVKVLEPASLREEVIKRLRDQIDHNNNCIL
ncbi:MAG: hypothetical protein APF81_12770 [Desulfosporosinus sp. BRH_c37]|nr:MAG: hypothetical protein APF81_12770 [Desulfosporosinus sp. BRH_c37]